MAHGRRTSQWLLGLTIAVVGVLAVGSGAVLAEASARTWFVKAGAAGGGDGSRHHPFATLAAVERAAGRGDRIVVLASPSRIPPLNGGIGLKRAQKLLGAGPPVTALSASAAAPRITNTTSAHFGDAVTLASGDVVSNLVVAGAQRGGIYGHNVRNVTVAGNDLSATNTSCTTGFVVQHFVLPLFAPGAGVPFSSGLSNGWAAIMIDEFAHHRPHRGERQPGSRRTLRRRNRHPCLGHGPRHRRGEAQHADSP